MTTIPAGDETVTVSDDEFFFVTQGWPPFSTDSPLWNLHQHGDGTPCCNPDPDCNGQTDRDVYQNHPP